MALSRQRGARLKDNTPSIARQPATAFTCDGSRARQEGHLKIEEQSHGERVWSLNMRRMATGWNHTALQNGQEAGVLAVEPGGHCYDGVLRDED